MVVKKDIRPNDLDVSPLRGFNSSLDISIDI